MGHGTRGELLGHLTELIDSLDLEHPTRAAFDGPPGAGKTTLADEVAVALRARGRFVIRATVDAFLFPRAHRYRCGEFSGEGCYADAHDTEALARVLLDPLGPTGDRRCRTAVRDHLTDAEMFPPLVEAPDDAVLLFDGVFLMRPELDGHWDLRILVAASPQTTVERAVAREGRVATRSEVERRWRERYLPAQRHYAATVRPVDHADVVVDNDDPLQPQWGDRTS